MGDLVTPLDDPPIQVGSAPGAAPASTPGAAFHHCPTCGYPHWTPPDIDECMCGHPSTVHKPASPKGRATRPCTVWDPIECPCEDYTQ